MRRNGPVVGARRAVPLRVLYVISSSGPGGAETVVLQDLRGLLSAGFIAHLACPDGELAAHARRLGVAVHIVDLSSVLRPAAYLKIYRLIRRERFDLVHTHLYNADVIGLTAAWASRAPLRVSTVHGPNFYYTSTWGLKRFHYAFAGLVYRAVYMFAHQIATPSMWVKRRLVHAPGWRVGAVKVEVVPNGVAVPDRPSHRTPPVPMIACVANFDIIKDHENLIHALDSVFSAVPGARICFAGTGPRQNAIRQKCAMRPWRRRVMFLGNVSNIGKLLDHTDVTVLPSRAEGMPMVLLESMSRGIPVVATRAGGVPELIAHGRTGLLADPGDSSSLAEHLIRLLTDSRLAAQLGSAARTSVRRSFGAERRRARLTELYHRLWLMRPAHPWRSRVFCALRLCGAAALFKWRSRRAVAILAYHGAISTPDTRNEDGLNIHPARFEEHMRLIAERFHPVTIEAAVEALRGGRDVPPNSVVVTFDDGLESQRSRLFPILQKYNIPSAWFVVTGSLDSGDPIWPLRLKSAVYRSGGSRDRFESRLETYLSAPDDVRRATEPFETSGRWRRGDDYHRPLTWRRLEALAVQPGVSIGAHTHTHAVVSRCDGAALENEIARPRVILERRLRRRVRWFAYPNGRPVDLNSRAIACLRRARYSAALTTEPGLNRPGCDLFRLKRISVNGHDTADALYASLCGMRPLTPAWMRA